MVAAAVRYFFWFVIASAGVLGSSGCVVVRAHERGHLAKRAMTDDRSTGETRFFGHERGSREGAEGGNGQPGGGCGCN
jgi:Domain of unknown function (DUF4266)